MAVQRATSRTAWSRPWVTSPAKTKASPADGGLKVTGVLWDDREFADKLKAHPKAVLLKARLGMPVSAAAVAKAEDELTKLRQEWAAA